MVAIRQEILTLALLTLTTVLAYCLRQSYIPQTTSQSPQTTNFYTFVCATHPSSLWDLRSGDLNFSNESIHEIYSFENLQSITSSHRTKPTSGFLRLYVEDIPPILVQFPITDYLYSQWAPERSTQSISPFAPSLITFVTNLHYKHTTTDWSSIYESIIPLPSALGISEGTSVADYLRANGPPQVYWCRFCLCLY